MADNNISHSSFENQDQLYFNSFDKKEIGPSPKNSILSSNEPCTSRQKQKIIVDANLTICDPTDPLRQRIIKDNSFANPLIIEAERHGRFTGHLEREITTFHSQGGDLVVQRGYARDFIRILEKNDITPELIERRTAPSATFPVLNGVTLRPYQMRAVNEAAGSSQGVLCAPTGAGKTVCGLELVRRKATTALVLVHRSELAQQWQKEIKRLFGITPGFIGNGSWEIGDLITIGMVQTLSKNEARCREMGDQIGLILRRMSPRARTIICRSDRVVSQISIWLIGDAHSPGQLDCLIHRAIGPIVAKIERKKSRQSTRLCQLMSPSCAPVLIRGESFLG